MIFKQLLAYKTRRTQSKNQPTRMSTSFRKASQVGVIFSYENPEKSAIVDRLIEDLKSDGKKVKVLAYEQNNQVKHLPYDSFSQKDISFWCKYIKQTLNNFVDHEFDFLICVDDHPGLLIRNILANSKAKCRVGKNDSTNQKSFELMIGADNYDHAHWVATMYDNLKKIN